MPDFLGQYFPPSAWVRTVCKSELDNGEEIIKLERGRYSNSRKIQLSFIGGIVFVLSMISGLFYIDTNFSEFYLLTVFNSILILIWIFIFKKSPRNISWDELLQKPGAKLVSNDVYKSHIRNLEIEVQNDNDDE